MPALSGGPYVNDVYTFPASSRRQYLFDSLRTSLLAATWTSSVLRPKSTFTWTANPANNSTITLNGKVYTFQTVLTNVNGNVLIGATLADSITNLRNAIMLGPGSGTTYAAATTAPTGVTVLLFDATTITICGSTTTNPYTDFGLALSSGGTINGTWAVTSLTRGGWIFKSPESSVDFAQGCFVIWADTLADGSGGSVFISIATRDASEVANYTDVVSATSAQITTQVTSTLNAAFTSAGIQFRVVASPRMVSLNKPFSTANDGENFFYNIAIAPSFMRGKKISGASNTTPITITTTASHGYTTGQTVRCLYINGNTAANTTATITVLSSTQFQLDGTVGNGAYTSGGICINISLKEVGEAISSIGCNASGGAPSVRNSVSLESSALAGNKYIFNGTFYNNNAGGGVGYRAVYTFPLGNTVSSINQWQNDTGLLLDPWISFPAGGTPSSASRVTAQWVDVAWVSEASPVDTVPSPFLSRSWMSLQNNVANISWLIVTG